MPIKKKIPSEEWKISKSVNEGCGMSRFHEMGAYSFLTPIESHQVVEPSRVSALLAFPLIALHVLVST